MKLNCSISYLLIALFLLLVTHNHVFAFSAVAATPSTLNQRYTIPGTYTFTVPEGVTSITVETWGGGGRGGSRTSSTDGTGGGGGGAFSRHVLSVTPGVSYVVNVGAGSTSNSSAGGDSWVSISTVSNAFVLAKGGNSVATNSNTGATGGSSGSGIGATRYSGGNGANRVSSTSSGGGGSSAGTGANGTNASGTTGGVAPSGGGNGGNGRTSIGSGNAGQYPGGGGGGAVRGSSGSPGGGSGGHGQVNISYTFNVDAGPNQIQCHNALFFVSTPTPPSGYTATWSVISGQGYIYDNSKLNTTVIVRSGSSATVRLTVTNGSVTATDDVVLTNTTSCSTPCNNPLNDNGDLEQSGSISNYNLSFQSTPAALIYQNTNPIGWAEAYGSNSPNTSAFTGAYHINKTGSNGNPRSGTKMVYMAGNGFCLSNLKTGNQLHCGKTYRVSVWVAAYTNGGTQANSPFLLEFFSGGDNLPNFNIGHSALAPASTSWNSLNWQRYSFEFTIPASGYQWSDFVFTTLSATNGIVIDDMCVEEIFSGSASSAGPDLFDCSSNFTMAGNLPPTGHSGNWSVVSGNASITNPGSRTSNVTINSGNAARLRWTVSASGGNNTILALDPKGEGGFEKCCSASDNGWSTANASTNTWQIGTVSNPTSGTRAAYISNNGGTSYAYTITSSQTSHLYRDITVYPDATSINLSFKWKGQGESGFDRLLVYTAPTSVTPVAGTPASSSTTLSGATLRSSTSLHSSTNYETVNITLPNSLAGTTFRLIFTWQNNASTGTNPPASIDEISLSYSIPACSNSDEVNIGIPSSGTLVVNDDYICPGENGSLTVSGCTGSVLWSTGSTQSVITASPTVSTSYSVTCTASSSSNLLLNSGYESSTNLQYWSNWGNTSITTSGSNVYAGSKAAMINTIGQSWGGVAQSISSSSGVRYRVRVYAKTTNTNALPLLRYIFYNGGNAIEEGVGPKITSTSYQLYEYEFVSPPNTTSLTVYADIGGGGQLFLDAWEVVSFTSCNSSTSGTINVGETNSILNPEFDQSTSNWNLYVQSGNSASLSLDNTSQLSGANSARVNISTASGTNWHIQLLQQNVLLQAGKIYGVSFRAKAVSNRTITFFVDQGESPYTSYFSQDISLTNTSQTFVYTFTQPGSLTNGRVGFNMGQSTQNVWVDNIEFFEVCQSFEICDNGIDDDGDGLIDEFDPDCAVTCTTPDFIFEDPVLISGTANAVGSVYLFEEVIPNVDARITYVSRSHSDIVLASFDEPAATNGGYDFAFQPIIDYNWLNPDGSMESEDSDKFITFKIDFYIAGTSTPYSIPTFKMSAIDVDGNGVDIREFIETTGFEGFQLETPTSLVLSGALRATGSLPAFDGVDETALTSMITFDYLNTNSVTLNYGGRYIAGSTHNNNSENRLNCLFFKCYEYNTSISCPTLEVDGPPNICLGQDATLMAEFSYSDTKIKPVNSYLCLNPNGSTTNNTVVVQSNCNNSPFENWRLEMVPGYTDRYYIRNLGSNLYIRPLNGATANGTNITQASGNDITYHWQIENHSVGRFHVRHVQSGRYMDVNGGNLSAGTPMIIWNFHGGSNQQFYIDPGAIPYYPSVYSYTWSTGSTNSTIVVSPTTQQTYSVSITSPTNNCLLVESLTVNVSNPSTSVSGTNAVCQGQSSVFTATGGGSYLWNTGQTTNAITVSTAGTYTVTVTDATGCTATSSRTLTVYNLPSPPIIGTITHPTCITATGSVALSGLPASGSWTLTRSPGGTTYNGSGTSYTVTGLPVNATYTFTITSSQNCTSTSSANVIINAIQPPPTLGGSSSLCIGNTANVTPSTNGTWSSSNEAIATITNAGVVTGLTSGAVTLTYTRTSDGCSNDMPFSVYSTPSAPVLGTITQPNCVIMTGSVILNDLPSSGSWTITRSPGGNTYVDSGTSYTISNLAANSNFTFTVTNNDGCVSPVSNTLNINSVPTNPGVSIDYMGSVCITDNKEISADITGGVSPFSYNWSGPSGYSSGLETITITNNGNYYLTVTDANLCTATTSGFVYARYEPFIVSLNTEVCEGQQISMDVNSASAVSYLWSANANNATTKIVTVMPTLPSSTYYVTVTNNLGCTGVPEITINVNPKPIISVTGPDAICVGQTTSVSPTSGGVWTSTNSGVATVNNSGVVTGVSSGTATFIFTESTNNCASNASAPIIVHPNPVAMVTGLNSICVGDSTTVTPFTGGTWISSNPAVATINNEGLIFGLSAGSATFTYTNDSTLCSSNASAPVSITALPEVTISGPDSFCINTNILLTNNFPGGIWSSSNPDVAFINNSGIVTSVDTGLVSIYYNYISGPCIGQAIKDLYISENPSVQYSGPAEICVGQTTSLTPNEGGVWISSSPTIASVNNNGLVTALQSGYSTFTFQNSTTGCISEPSSTLTVFTKPSISVSGPSGICIGNTTTLLPFNGGTWVSSNPSVASVTNGGIVSGNSAGSAFFTYTHNETGCNSDPSTPVVVGSVPSASIDFQGSVCLTDTSKISVEVSGGTPSYTYNWVGPLGFSGNTEEINITNNGTYYVTVTDSYGCKTNVSGFVYQRFEPVIVNVNTTVCEGQSVQLSVNASSPASYLWSANAGSATTSQVNVVPTVPSSIYYVTVTNTLGCRTVANANINVNVKPIVQISGPDSICIGQNTTMTPASGGTWVSLNPSVASINNSGLVTGISLGTARFLFTQSSTGCTSDTSGIVTVNSSTTISIGGPSTICVGAQTQLNPSSGGTWTALHPTIATINGSGTVFGLSQGIAQFSFTNNNGCTTNGTLSITVNNKPSILLDGPNQICVGSTTQFLPSSGGTWTSSNSGIASITNSGLVTGISGGNAKFVYTNTFSGCKSDSSVIISVVAGSLVSITGPNPICVGSTTTLSPTSGGSWVSNNPTVATVNSSGIVTGLSQGNVTFTFTNSTSNCPSLPTGIVTVNARPVALITGPTSICIGATTTLSPTTGGTWVSSNPARATVTNGGLVTGVSAGLVSFTFTNSTTGCISLPSGNLTVHPKPNVSINATSICIGGTTTLQPSTGGVWTSSNPSVATTTNSGIVTGIAQGVANFIFTENSTGCVSNPTANLNVLPKPVVSITGPSEICQGFTTQLSPTSGGTWSSLQPTIASVSSSGLVTGLLNGTAQFVFTSSQGCASNPTNQVVINGKPSYSFSGPSSICVGSTTQLNPTTGGTWVSSNPGVATISSSGLVSGISPGGAKFVFTNTSTGCISDSTPLVMVYMPASVSLIGPSQMCIGQTSQLSPTTGGTWISLTPTIATISNSGLITGIGAGQASFIFVQSSTGCETTFNNATTTLPRPPITLTGSSSICIGGSTQFIPTSGGTWASSNPSVASIDNSGIVTGLSQGLASFVFTSQSTGCLSSASNPVTVLAKPSVSLNGTPTICIGGNTQFLPSAGGTWTSSNPLIATINNQGLVTGVSSGIVSFVFTNSSTGCSSNASTNITVNPSATLSVSGPTDICLGYNTTLSASTAGLWYSTRPGIATSTSNGLVKGQAPGKVTFYFVEAASGCITYLPNDVVTVINCIDPDFNVTMVNVPVTGNVSTNDEVPDGTSYLSTVLLISKPTGSTASLTMNSNGTYTFQGNMPGKYTYNVMVCLPPMTTNCPVSNLVFKVINPNTESENILPNMDVIYTYENQNITINTLHNDACLSGLTCEIDPDLISIFDTPGNGSATVLVDGSIQYTPNQNFVGIDTLVYEICAGDNPINCAIASQYISVMASNANNSLSASDDFFAVYKGQNLVAANLINNDFDPEGGLITINPVGDVQNPALLSSGSYYITPDGELFFTPNVLFSGPVDIIYTICDQDNFCVNGTAHILVLENLSLRIRAYLEGALMENGNAKAPDNRPLMRDNLRMSPFTGTNYLPTFDPYTIPTTYFDLSSTYAHVGNGNQNQFTHIPNPFTVFAVTGQNAIVDWVYIELRSKTDNTLVLGTRSALIQRDGDVVDLDGVSPVEFPGIRIDSCYVVLRHRNHFGVMSKVVSTSNLLDFTVPATPTFDYGTSRNDGYNYSGLAQKSDVILGYTAMWAGDFDGNGRIKFINPNDDQNILFFEVLSFPTNVDYMANYNFSYGYFQADYDLNSKSKYDNPNDDKNMLFYQVLFHPLNVNYISNFNFIIEQVPPARIE